MKITFLEPLGLPKENLKKIMETIPGTQNEFTYYDDRNEDPKVLTERGQGADCVVLSNIKFGREIMEECPQLKMVCVAFTGVDLVDIEYCRKKGIRVCNCAGYSTVAVADLVFGFVLNLARKIQECNEAVRIGGTKQGLVGFELEGKKFGVIGAGAIGQRVLRIAQAFGCETFAYNRSPKEIPGVTFVSLEELLKKCDIISVHVPQTRETIGLLGEEQFAMMKKNALFINTARGPIVDSAALAKALKEEKIAGAAVDVFEMEPPVNQDHAMFGVKNLIATPHVAFASQQAFEKRALIVAENIKCWLEGNMQNVIC